MDGRRRPGRRPYDSYRLGSDGRRYGELPDRFSRSERPPGEACPICAQFSAPIEDLIVHIIVFHKYEDAILRTSLDEFPPREGEYICANCRFRLRDAPSLYSHFFNDHRPELFDSLQSAAAQTRGRGRSHDLQPLLSRFASAAPRRVVLQTLPPPPPPADLSDPIDSEEDETYIQFIAGSISSEGIASRDRVEIPEVAPIRPANVEARHAAPVVAAIDKQFWADLDRLDACMRVTGKVEITDEAFKCKICKKTYNSGVRLLEHCWELHRNLLDD